jgi:putative transcriptional regulator
MTAAPHILGDEWLLDYAAGTAPEPVAVLIATHLALSPAARKAHACLEAVGGSLLESIEPAALKAGALDAVLARLDAPAAAPLPQSQRNDIVPAVLQRYLPGGLAAVKWRTLARGIQQSFIPCSDARGFRLSLMRVAPERPIPRHTHRGEELVLVLDGGYHDEFGHYGPGDVESADASIEHHPMTDPGGDCIGLVVDQGPARLTGPLGRLINPFMP